MDKYKTEKSSSSVTMFAQRKHIVWLDLFCITITKKQYYLELQRKELESKYTWSRTFCENFFSQRGTTNNKI